MFKPLMLLVASTFALSACDQVNQRLGIDDPVRKEAKLEAEGKAVGSACRHSGRAIEDCYSIYRWLNKAHIYSGWLEMDTYMRENGLETIAPQLPPAPPPEPPPEKKKKKKTKPEGGEGGENGKEGDSGTAAADSGKEAPKEAGGKH